MCIYTLMKAYKAKLKYYVPKGVTLVRNCKLSYSSVLRVCLCVCVCVSFLRHSCTVCIQAVEHGNWTTQYLFENFIYLCIFNLKNIGNNKAIAQFTGIKIGSWIGNTKF